MHRREPAATPVRRCEPEISATCLIKHSGNGSGLVRGVRPVDSPKQARVGTVVGCGLSGVRSTDPAGMVEQLVGVGAVAVVGAGGREVLGRRRWGRPVRHDPSKALGGVEASRKGEGVSPGSEGGEDQGSSISPRRGGSSRRRTTVPQFRNVGGCPGTKRP